jgi:hypothetical protein
MQKEIYIKSASAILKIVAEEDILNQTVRDDFFVSYIPSAEIVESDTFDATIIVEKGATSHIDIEYPVVKLTYASFHPKDLVSLAEYVLERSRQEKGIICVHGAGAIVDNKAVVSWGTATGMGKTTLALEIADNGNEFYSDEKVLVDLINGTVVGRIANQYISNDYWRKKYGNDKFRTPDNLSSNITYDIGLFVHAIVCNQLETMIDNWTADKFFWHLYEESCRKIRGTSRMFFGFTTPIESLDTIELATKRIEWVREFTRKIPAIYFKGKAKVAVDTIVDILNKK